MRLIFKVALINMKLELKSPLTHFVYGAGVAQPVERGAVNPVVGGSNPPPGATTNSSLTYPFYPLQILLNYEFT